MRDWKGTQRLRITATHLHGDLDRSDPRHARDAASGSSGLHQTNEILVGTMLRANPSRSPRVLRRIIARSVVTERAGHTKRAIHLLWRSLQH
jgi:hypothetical protein